MTLKQASLSPIMHHVISASCCGAYQTTKGQFKSKNSILLFYFMHVLCNLGVHQIDT